MAEPSPLSPRMAAVAQLQRSASQRAAQAANGDAAVEARPVVLARSLSASERNRQLAMNKLTAVAPSAPKTATSASHLAECVRCSLRQN